VQCSTIDCLLITGGGASTPIGHWHITVLKLVRQPYLLAYQFLSQKNVDLALKWYFIGPIAFFWLQNAPKTTQVGELTMLPRPLTLMGGITPPNTFPLDAFGAYGPDTIILFIVDYHAAMGGGKTPVLPLAYAPAE